MSISQKAYQKEYKTQLEAVVRAEQEANKAFDKWHAKYVQAASLRNQMAPLEQLSGLYEYESNCKRRERRVHADTALVMPFVLAALRAHRGWDYSLGALTRQVQLLCHHLRPYGPTISYQPRVSEALRELESQGLVTYRRYSLTLIKWVAV